MRRSPRLRQSLDGAGLAVVIAEPDGLGVVAVCADRVAELAEPGVRRLMAELRGPLEGRVRLGHEATDRDGATDVAGPRRLAPGGDDLLGEVGDLQDVLVGLGRQAAHEVELHLSPAGCVGRSDRPDEVVLGDRLVDDAPDSLRPALGRERQSGPSSVAAELVGEVDVECVDAGARQD